MHGHANGSVEQGEAGGTEDQFRHTVNLLWVQIDGPVAWSG